MEPVTAGSLPRPQKGPVAVLDARRQVQANGAPIHDFEAGGRRVARLQGPNGVDADTFAPEQKVAETYCGYFCGQMIGLTSRHGPQVFAWSWKKIASP